MWSVELFFLAGIVTACIRLDWPHCTSPPRLFSLGIQPPECLVGEHHYCGMLGHLAFQKLVIKIRHTHTKMLLKCDFYCYLGAKTVSGTTESWPLIWVNGTQAVLGWFGVEPNLLHCISFIGQWMVLLVTAQCLGDFLETDVSTVLMKPRAILKLSTSTYL